MDNTTIVVSSASTIWAAARRGGGDYCATVRHLAIFCTEALVDAAYLLRPVSAKFAQALPTWRLTSRDEAIDYLRGWASASAIAEWSTAFEACCVEVRAAMPQVLEALGAAI